MGLMISLPGWRSNSGSLPVCSSRSFDQAKHEHLVCLRPLGPEATIHHVLKLITRLKQVCTARCVDGRSTPRQNFIQTTRQSAKSARPSRETIRETRCQTVCEATVTFEFPVAFTEAAWRNDVRLQTRIRPTRVPDCPCTPYLPNRPWALSLRQPLVRARTGDREQETNGRQAHASSRWSPLFDTPSSRCHVLLIRALRTGVGRTGLHEVRVIVGHPLVNASNFIIDL